ncbi:hypothetical protein D6D21_05808 [Aureobasidium pullulans]|uniref:Uncharacterized protein n=1 Tax=Aureobasidium pullulans TaxID=5580 RepID=A0AB74IX29_AURPU|nr:hypothetical protein D6D21_05808 [Aureobasidium pullulans]
MCGETNRPVLGGTIAILKSLGESTLPDLSLLFHQDSTSTTRATFQSSLPAVSDLDSCQIVILWRSESRSTHDIDITCIPIEDDYERAIVQFAEEVGFGGWWGRCDWEKGWVGEASTSAEAGYHWIQLMRIEEGRLRN